LRDYENRRFLCVELNAPIDDGWVAEYHEMLLGEAYDLFVKRREHNKPFLDKTWMEEGHRTKNRDYTEQLPNQEIIAEYVAGLEEVYINDVNVILRTSVTDSPLNGTSLNTRPATQADVNLGEPILRMLGFEREPQRKWRTNKLGQKQLLRPYKRGENADPINPDGNKTVDPGDFLRGKYKMYVVTDS
jgi:hypothetical protein